MEPLLDASAGGVWSPAAPEPTNLLAFLPEPEVPSVEEVLAHLDAAGHAARLIERIPRPDDPEIRWCAALEPAVRNRPVVLWSEPARPQAIEGTPETAGVASCRWVLGLETILDEIDPLTDLAAILRIAIGAAPSARAVLDVNTTRWHMRDEIDQRARSGIEPPADDLFVVQVVTRPARHGGDDREVAWVHTHGLWRCGRPELEMLDVPARRAPVAAALVSDVAGLILEDGAGAPGAPLEIGHDLTVTLQPWQAVAGHVAPGAPGDDPHAGPRAVICGREPHGRDEKIWSWPQDVLERLAAGDAGIYLTARATERQGRLARASWSEVVAAIKGVGSLFGLDGPRSPREGVGSPFGLDGPRSSRGPGSEKTPDPSVGDPSVGFAVKASFRASEDAGREHLWFAAHGIDGERVEGELLNEPLDAHGMSIGDRRWIEPAQVSDWRVTTAEGSFGPEETAALRRFLDRVGDGTGDA